MLGHFSPNPFVAVRHLLTERMRLVSHLPTKTISLIYFVLVFASVREFVFLSDQFRLVKETHKRNGSGEECSNAWA
jgi:hypothetical protein